MAKVKRVAITSPKFKSFADAFDRALKGDEGAQRSIIGCLNNLGCDHLAQPGKFDSKTKWVRYYRGLNEYISALVGEYGESESKAEKEVLAELNEARFYSADVELEDSPKANLIETTDHAIAPEGDHE